MKKKKKGKFGKWIKKHKIATAIISIILICVLIIAGVIGSILWGLYKDSVGIVDPDDVDPTATRFRSPRKNRRTTT